MCVSSFQVSAAKFWFRRHEQNDNLNCRPRSGRKKVLSAEEEVDIVLRMEQDPFLTAKEFASEFQVSQRKITAVLNRHGIKCRTAATKLRLTEEHRLNRMAFCEMLLEHWDDDRLNSIIFSDEKTFSTDVSWRSKVYRPHNTQYHHRYMKVNDESGHTTHNYWGAIGIEGPLTPLVAIDGRFNSQRYIRILMRHVNPIMRAFQANDMPRIFMQGNSPIHTAEIVINHFANQNYEVMAWPAKSTDLNPIENVCSKMMRDWPEIYPRNQQTLDEEVQNRWNALGGDGGRYILLVSNIAKTSGKCRWASSHSQPFPKR